MDNIGMNTGMSNEQAFISTPKINPMPEIEKLSKKQARFRQLRMGSLLYALVYTFCIFRNSSVITYPFFFGATLLYFVFYTKEYT